MTAGYVLVGTRGTTMEVESPAELAPALRERVQELLAEVSVVREELPRWWSAGNKSQNRCVVCGRDGKLGGHHGANGRIEWIHRSCHRRLHSRHHSRPPVAARLAA